MTVVSPSGVPASWGWQAVADGTVAATLGGGAFVGFGVEAVKSFVHDEAAGRWWFVACALLGLALVGLGLWLRERTRRHSRAGLVVDATDSRRGSAFAERQHAETFSRNRFAVTLRTGVELSGDGRADHELVSALADETLSAIALAERLTPDAGRINMIPTMPLHVAFLFGARLGDRHGREVVVHAIRQGQGRSAYFPATSLRAVGTTGAPLRAERPEVLDDGDPTIVALALDLEGRGEDFFDYARVACRRHGVGMLLRSRVGAHGLAENHATFTAVVEQAVRTWEDAPLTTPARTGRHVIFLNGPAAIAVALGARLASREYGRWTVFGFDVDTSTYEPFPHW